MASYPTESYILIPPKGQLPTAESAYKDQLFMVRGTPDKLYICRYTGSAYEFIELTLIGDPDLIAIAAITTFGILVRTAADTWTTRTLASTSSGLVVTNGDGVAGAPSLALDAEIQAFAALVSAADRLPYYTGVGTAALATFTAFARTLLDDADQATMRATLALTPGTDVQAFDADLSALAALAATAGMLARTGAGTFAVRTIASTSSGLVVTNGDGAAGAPSFALDAEIQAFAALTSAADALPYYTGAGTAATTTLTSFIRGLLDDANAAAAQSTLGLVISTNVQAWDADLDALAALAATAGMLARTGAGTFAVRTITGTANQITVANGTGASADPTLSITTNPTLPGNVTATGSVTVQSAATIYSGSGSPEDSITASEGSLYLRTDADSLKGMYFKSDGAGNDGWTPVDGFARNAWESGAHHDPGATTISVVGMTAWTIPATAASNDGTAGSFLNNQTGGVSGNTSGPNGPLNFRTDWEIDCVFHCSVVDTTLLRLHIGLYASDPSGSATPTINMAGFRFDTGAGDTAWQCRTADGAAGANSASGVNIATGVITLRMQLQSTFVRFYINDVWVATRTGNLPTSTALLAPYCRVTTLTGAAKNIRFGYFNALSQ